MKFKDLLTESKDVAALVKTLNDYDATIVLHPSPSEKDLLHWVDGSIDYAEDFAEDFDMTEKEFIAFCNQIKKNSKAIAKLL